MRINSCGFRLHLPRAAKVVCIASVFIGTGPALAADVDVKSLIKIPSIEINYKEPLPFKIGIALNNNKALASSSPPYASVVIELQENGTPTVVATHQSPRKIMVLAHQKLGGITGYNLAHAANNWQSNFIIRALDRNVKQFFMPTYTPELGAHETAFPTRDGNLFMYYWPKDYSDGTKIIELGLREYDRVGTLLWDWVSERISPIHSSVTKATPANGYSDYLHANSISTYKNFVVVSARNSSEILLIDRETKRLSHKIGLLDSWVFQNDPLNGFRFQHHANIDDGGILSVLDNGGTYNEPWDRPTTRAVRYKLDFEKKMATLIDALPIYGALPQRTRQGSYTVLNSGYSIVSWGLSEPKACDGVTEKPVVVSVFKNGQVVADMRADCGWFTYRAIPLLNP